MKKKVSVSLWSIIHSYDPVKRSIKIANGEFPSPYGVSFILILDDTDLIKQMQDILRFPSPYGVSFILILDVDLPMDVVTNTCFRLLMEYHSFL